MDSHVNLLDASVFDQLHRETYPFRLTDITLFRDASHFVQQEPCKGIDVLCRQVQAESAIDVAQRSASVNQVMIRAE
jgi:hypothetical protein